MTRGLDARLEDLDWSRRALRILKRAGCRTLADVLAKWPFDIARLSGVGAVVMREVHERLSLITVEVRPIPPLPRPRRGGVVSVPYSPDRRTFLEEAAIAWQVHTENARLRQAADEVKRSERAKRASLLDTQHLELLRCFLEGLPIKEIAARSKCGETVMRAKRERLIRQYARAPYLARLPADLQRFVLDECMRRATHVLVSRALDPQGFDVCRPRRLPPLRS